MVQVEHIKAPGGTHHYRNCRASAPLCLISSPNPLAEKKSSLPIAKDGIEAWIIFILAKMALTVGMSGLTQSLRG